jgi:hypothetical protein
MFPVCSTARPYSEKQREKLLSQRSEPAVISRQMQVSSGSSCREASSLLAAATKSQLVTPE